LRIAHPSLLLLVIFVADAAISVWQRGDRRRALLVSGSIISFVVTGTELVEYALEHGILKKRG
jgi:hypothetical protein